MHRRMPLLIALVATLALTGVALAQPDCTVLHCVYVPNIQVAPTMTPIPPTPVPPDISTLVIQPSYIASGYDVDASMAVPNDLAASTYADPSVALTAFAQQGREISWFIRYLSSDYIDTDAVGIADQVTRYLTLEGAAQGQAYVIAKVRADDRTWQPVALTIPGFASINLQRTFKIDKVLYRQFYISVQVGRYVVDVQVLGRDGVVTTQSANRYTQIGIYLVVTRIPDGPPLPMVTVTSDLSLPLKPLRVAMTPQ